MAWTFRKRIKIIPGIHLNISKRGISTTIGVRGASINIGPNGTFVNTALPGLGIRSRHKLSRKAAVPAGPIPLPAPVQFPVPAQIPPAGGWPGENIFSLDPNEITSQDMQGIKDAILLAHRQRNELFTDRLMVVAQLESYESRLKMSYWLLYGFIFKEKTRKLKEDIAAQQ